MHLPFVRVVTYIDLVFAAHAFIHLPVPPSSPGGAERAAREMAVAEEKKHLQREKARKHMER
jgi:hypothetical protein